MHLRNGEHGYGLVTKALHWGTLALLSAQFAVGYAMDADAAVDRADAAIDAREDACESENDAAEERCEDALDRQEAALKDEGDYAVFDGSWDLVDLHVLLGLVILALAIARTAWRIGTPLPPWDDRLGAVDRKIAHATEVVLLATMYVIPTTGLAMVLTGEDDVLPLHIGSHLVFFVALLAHVGLVLRRGLLARML